MFRRLHKHEGAQGLVEFALMIPVFLILVFGIIDFGFGLKAYITVSQAVREGARYGSIGNPPGPAFTSCTGATPTTVIGKVCSTMNGLNQANVQSITATCTTACTSGNALHVSAQYRYYYITPIKALVGFFTVGALPSYLTVGSSTDMRIE